MAEPALALREHPQIIELFTVLEQNGLHFDTLESFGEYEVIAVFKTVAYSEEGFK